MRLVEVAAGLAVMARLFASAAAMAAAIEPGRTFGDWQSECETPADGKARCFVSQTRVVQDQKSGTATRLLKTSLGYFGPAGQAVLVVVLPLGVDLRAGAAFRIDEEPPLALTLQQCLAEGCFANLALDERTLTSLRKSKGAQILLRPFGSPQTVAIPVSSKGISDGLAALKS